MASKLNSRLPKLMNIDPSDKQLREEALDKQRAQEEALHAEGSKVLAVLAAAATASGAKGKIPRDQRAQWSRNVQNILNRLEANGYRTREIYEAGLGLPDVRDYEDLGAFRKVLRAISITGEKQQTGYSFYLDLIRRASQLPGEDLFTLGRELTSNISLSNELTGIPEEAFRIARQLELIAKELDRKHDLLNTFRVLAEIRERHLCEGGTCVWPDSSFRFEDGDYTPRPGLTVRQALKLTNSSIDLAARKQRGKNAENVLDLALSDPRLATRVSKPDLDRLLQQLVQKPLLRRQARHAYHIDSELHPEPTTPGDNLVLSWVDDALHVLPVYYAGVLFDAIGEPKPKRYTFRATSELWQDGARAYGTEPLPETDYLFAPDSDAERRFIQEQHCAIFLYPDPQLRTLLPVIKTGCEEWTYLHPIDAVHLNALDGSLIFDRHSSRAFPLEAESLMTHLARVIQDGSLAAEWERSLWRLGDCPLWSVTDRTHPEQQRLLSLREEG
jgi:hypothetical protein